MPDIVACESNAQRLAQLRTRLNALEDRAEFRLVDVTLLADVSAVRRGAGGCALQRDRDFGT